MIHRTGNSARPRQLPLLLRGCERPLAGRLAAAAALVISGLLSSCMYFAGTGGALRPIDPASWVDEIEDYPQSAIARRQSGTTIVDVTADASGRVTGCAIVSSSGSDHLDRATCVWAPRRGRFIPGSRNAARPPYRFSVYWDFTKLTPPQQEISAWEPPVVVGGRSASITSLDRAAICPALSRLAYEAAALREVRGVRFNSNACMMNTPGTAEEPFCSDLALAGGIRHADKAAVQIRQCLNSRGRGIKVENSYQPIAWRPMGQRVRVTGTFENDVLLELTYSSWLAMGGAGLYELTLTPRGLHNTVVEQRR